MSKSAMLRTRRRDVNVKPNRRLDRKSSRGMIYENEELRLRTININAEIERGQSDIKKLRRENEQLRKEIWCLRDEYEKLDKLLKNKEDRTSCSSCTSDTDSCTSCSESEENETTQNIENVQKTTLNNLRTEFDHLSVVTEETSAENSDKNSNCATSPKECLWEALPPDQSYPNSQTLPLRAEQMPRHFFAPLKTSQSYDNCHENNFDKLAKCAKTAPDILVKTDGQESNTNSFTNGGNLDELLHDIQSISNDILEISKSNEETIERPYKSELNVVLMPKSMPLLGFDKYQNIKSSLESLTSIKKSIESLHMLDIPPPDNFTPQPFPTDFLNFPPPPIPPPEFNRQCSNPFFNGSNCLQAHDNFGFKNEVIQQSSAKAEEKIDEIVENKPEKEAKEKPQRTRKVSIYFKGKKDKLARSLSLDTKIPQDTTSGESKTSLFESPKNPETENKTSSDSKNSNYDRKHRKSSSTSPERKHVHIKPENEKKCHKKRHRKSDRRLPATRRTSMSADRSFSICTDRSNILDNKFGHFEDYTNSERDRSNSLSSCDTVKSRKLSAPPQFQVSGKIPWFGCWGNGCL